MSIWNKGFSALGRLLIAGGLAAVFLFAMAGVVYMSLQGEEIKVPEIVGKDFVESEDLLADLGLKIKKRADRYSTEKPNTILEQLPKPGETVKTGQMILVVLSKSSGEPEELPTSLKKDIEADDTEKIEEMISEKPKKSKANTNSAKKKADKKRDVIGEDSNSNSNTAEPGKTDDKGGSDKANKSVIIGPSNRPSTPPANRQAPSKPPGGDPVPRNP